MLRQHGRDAVRRGDGRRYDPDGPGPRMVLEGLQLRGPCALHQQDLAQLFHVEIFLRDHQQRQLYSIGRAHRRGRRERTEVRHGAGLCRPGVRLLHADPVVPADLQET